MNLMSPDRSVGGNLINPARANPADFEEDEKPYIVFRGTTRRVAFITFGTVIHSSLARGELTGVFFLCYCNLH